MFVRLASTITILSHAFIAMAILSFHWLIMGKGKTGLYCYLTVDILIKILQKCFLSFFSIVAMTTEGKNADLKLLQLFTQVSKCGP